MDMTEMKWKDTPLCHVAVCFTSCLLLLGEGGGLADGRFRFLSLWPIGWGLVFPLFSAS